MKKPIKLLSSEPSFITGTSSKSQRAIGVRIEPDGTLNEIVTSTIVKGGIKDGIIETLNTVYKIIPTQKGIDLVNTIDKLQEVRIAAIEDFKEKIKEYSDDKTMGDHDALVNAADYVITQAIAKSALVVETDYSIGDVEYDSEGTNRIPKFVRPDIAGKFMALVNT